MLQLAQTSSQCAINSSQKSRIISLHSNNEHSWNLAKKKKKEEEKLGALLIKGSHNRLVLKTFFPLLHFIALASTPVSKSFAVIKSAETHQGGSWWWREGSLMPFLPMELETASQAPRSAQTGPCLGLPGVRIGTHPPSPHPMPLASYLCFTHCHLFCVIY